MFNIKIIYCIFWLIVYEVVSQVKIYFYNQSVSIFLDLTYFMNVILFPKQKHNKAIIKCLLSKI